MATQMAAPYSAAQPWYHGTDSGKFSAWQLPAPPKDPVTPASPAIYFTQDEGYARGAGKNLCVVTLASDAKTLVPAQGGVDSHSLRAKLSADPEYGWCVHLANDQAWRDAWATGEVMRLHFSSSHTPSSMFASKASQLRVKLNSAGFNNVPDNKLMEVTMQFVTREWIDRIALSAKELGYQALIGCEVDRWYGKPGQVMPPVARSWMALLDTSAVTSPTWI